MYSVENINDKFVIKNLIKNTTIATLETEQEAISYMEIINSFGEGGIKKYLPNND
jgi:hypothetical protein